MNVLLRRSSSPTTTAILRGSANSLLGNSILPSWGPRVRLLSQAVESSPMFDKILIANRGEIACRVMRTARRMGVKTVAVFSEADASAQHVQMADEAYCIGPAEAVESYLRTDKIMDVIKASGAQAVHPGYGFLSENAEFAEALESADVTFIGPPASAIRSMGSKSASKVIMTSASVPVTPGYHGEDQSEAVLQAEADAMGYPVLLKAVLGGGGKGMRAVGSAQELPAALQACKREAAAAFGDDRVLVERLITAPRHVELQVFCDSHGGAVYLHERDCSVQRRHQKVLEEAPAPLLSPALRQRMGEAAVAAARAVDYVGAGTVEFMLDSDGSSFYFMEMNTRLQVEHPVTELITGQDLVEWQLRVAAGQPLPLSQSQLTVTGHAIEARVYAENPANDFLPGSGHLAYLQPPPVDGQGEAGAGIRVDSGVVQGDEVSIHYDPMIAKLIAHGRDRGEAVRRLAAALSRYHVVGVPTNIPFLRDCLLHPEFVAGGVNTGFIEQHKHSLLPSSAGAAATAAASPPDAIVALAALAVTRQAQTSRAERAAATQTPGSPWAGLSPSTAGFRVGSAPALTAVFSLPDGAGNDSTVVSVGQDSVSLRGGDVTLSLSALSFPDANTVSAVIDGVRCTATAVTYDNSLHLFPAQSTASDCDSQPALNYVLPLPLPGYQGSAAADARPVLVAPMPGKVVRAMVAAGDSVEAGSPLIILEAMKMEHVIRAPCAAVIDSVPFGEGEFVDDGKLLVEFTPVGEQEASQ